MVNSISKKKLAVLYGPLLHYRIDLFNALCDRYDVTVFATSYNGPRDNLRFALEVIPARSIWRLKRQPGLRRRLRALRFDICIVFADVAYLDAMAAIFFPPSPRLLIWGPWPTGNTIANWLRLLTIRQSEATLFYCHQHLEAFIARGADPAKLYVAPNSVAVPDGIDAAPPAERNNILFVGSFNERKGLDRLIRLFAALLPRITGDVDLMLVGDGPERPRLEALVAELGLGSRVKMLGAVNDAAALAPIYASALVAVSLSQAGLSVLQSMGFGVPFMTVRGSISGGETLNIQEGVTGFMVDDDDAAIADALFRCIGDRQRSAVMGEAAREHYLRYATIENYAQGFYDALEGTRKAQIWRGGGPHSQSHD